MNTISAKDNNPLQPCSEGERLYNMALKYNEGADGTVRSERRTLSLLSQSAELKYAPAMSLIAQSLLNSSEEASDHAKAVQLLIEASEAGWSEAEVLLAYLYLEGLHVAKDEAKAIRMFRHAAAAGCPKAMCSLGYCYMLGQGVETDGEEASKWFLRAYECGLPECKGLSETALGGVQALKDAIKNDPSTKSEFSVVSQVEKGAAEGDAESLYQLSMYHINGIAFDWIPYEVNLPKAASLLRQAAEKGHLESAYTLGRLLQTPSDDFEQDYIEALKWSKFAASNGHVKAMVDTGVMYQRMGSPEVAVEWFAKAAEAGDAEAKGMLSYHYFFGLGIEADSDRAFNLARESATAGNAEGEKMLGMCYFDGRGVEENLEESFRWFVRAANQDETVGQMMAGSMLMGFYDYPDTDYELAEELLAKAAGKGNAKAMYSLGILYNNVMHKYQLAIETLHQAAKLGNRDALDALKQLCN